jgi:hypothetical protein
MCNHFIHLPRLSLISFQKRNFKVDNRSNLKSYQTHWIRAKEKSRSWNRSSNTLTVKIVQLLARFRCKGLPMLKITNKYKQELHNITNNLLIRKSYCSSSRKGYARFAPSSISRIIKEASLHLFKKKSHTRRNQRHLKSTIISKKSIQSKRLLTSRKVTLLIC